MNYKKLGNTDLEVSTICLGTMTWGEQNTENEGFEQMNYALDKGVNFWDTAEIYSVPPREETFGHTETIIGNWFEKTKKRDKVILALWSRPCSRHPNKAPPPPSGAPPHPSWQIAAASIARTATSPSWQRMRASAGNMSAPGPAMTKAPNAFGA